MRSQSNNYQGAKIPRTWCLGVLALQYTHVTVLSILLAIAALLANASPAQQRGRGGRGSATTEVFHTEVPAHPFDVILGRPTRNSVTASVLAYADTEVYLEYGPKKGAYAARTKPVRLEKGKPAEIVLDALQPDMQYYYRLRHRGAGGDWQAADESWFHTQRAPGSAFKFTVQADSHLDGGVTPELYARTLLNALAGKPDFHIDLGDTFFPDKRQPNFKASAPQYLAQRYYFGLLCHSAPLFFVVGNHDREGGSRYDGSGENMAAWSLGMRRRYLPNPHPDGFYTGNGTRDPVLGLLENYYAWEWGNALFVVLDPYWPTRGRRGARDDNWNWTLGEEQYRWLKKTLEQSQARFRFVFIHHPIGAKGQPIRGGIEAARYCEWGGKNEDGSDGFQQHRPGWEMPIHQLLVKNRVSILFHGHDHFFAKEELDGVIYQLVPQPGNAARGGPPRNAEEYGYVHGEVLGGSGHLRVTVSGSEARVDYVLSVLSKDETGSRKNGSTAHSYAIGAAREP